MSLEDHVITIRLCPHAKSILVQFQKKVKITNTIPAILTINQKVFTLNNPFTFSDLSKNLGLKSLYIIVIIPVKLMSKVTIIGKESPNKPANASDSIATVIV